MSIRSLVYDGMPYINQAQAEANRGYEFVVCPYCGGKEQDSEVCEVCNNTGQFYWPPHWFRDRRP